LEKCANQKGLRAAVVDYYLSKNSALGRYYQERAARILGSRSEMRATCASGERCTDRHSGGQTNNLAS